MEKIVQELENEYALYAIHSKELVQTSELWAQEETSGDEMESNANMYSKSSQDTVKEHNEHELTPLPPHLKYVYLEEGNKFPVIIAAHLALEQEK